MCRKWPDFDDLISKERFVFLRKSLSYKSQHTLYSFISVLIFDKRSALTSRPPSFDIKETFSNTFSMFYKTHFFQTMGNIKISSNLPYLLPNHET